jgi:amino-acid N-acetyltransferase
MKVEKARMSDVPGMHQLINHFAQRGEMLPRALSEIYENIRDFFVARNEKGEPVGCVALHVNWSDLAEVKSLAVSADKHRKGIGAMLVKACVEEAETLGIETVFCLTYKPDFFEKVGFKREDKAKLPRKVWTECYRCPKFPDCDEVALVYDGKKKPARTRRS